MRRIAGLIIAAMTTSSAFAADRFPPIPPEKMTPEQKAVADAIVSGPRGVIQGPFNAWLRAPELADRYQKVGEYLRYKTSLPPRLSEFAILITASEWLSEYEWYIHAPLAAKGGLPDHVLADLGAGRRPAKMAADEQAVYDFCLQLHRNKGKVSDDVHQAALKAFGEQGVVDLIGISGYYVAVAMTLGDAQVPLPAGVTTPLSGRK